MAIFNSYVKLPEGILSYFHCDWNHEESLVLWCPHSPETIEASHHKQEWMWHTFESINYFTVFYKRYPMIHVCWPISALMMVKTLQMFHVICGSVMFFFVSSFKCIRDGFGIRQLFEPHDARHIGLEHFHPGPHEGQFKSWWLSGAFVPFKKRGLTMFNLVQLSNRTFTWFNHV